MNIQSTKRIFKGSPLKEESGPSTFSSPPSGVKLLAEKSLDTVSTASSAVDRRPFLGKAFSLAGAAVRSGRALPEFAYPTIFGAAAAEKAQILETLDRLPLHHTSGVRSVRMVPEIPSHRENWVINGRASDLPATNRIQLSRKQLVTPDKFARTLTHEVGHTVDYESQTLGLFGERSTKQPFGEGPHITEYAKTNHREDFAESFEEYYLDPDNLKEKSPEKYDALKDLDKPSFLERMVDRKEFRETGKYMSEVFGENEVSRHGAQGAYYASSLVQAMHGMSQWVRSADNNDSMGHVSGILNTASGLAIASGINPLVGMSIQGANQALQKSVRRGRLGAGEVESTVSLPVRPLEAIFDRKTAKIQKDHRPAKVLAVAAGGALGGTVGSIVGPYLGVIGGYHVAGGLGGVVGLVAGGMLGFWAGAELGGRLGERVAGLHNQDSKFYMQDGDAT